MDPSDDMYLGRAAYEGYRERSRGLSLVSGQELPTWEAISDEIRAAWCSAANAVQQRLTEEVDHPDDLKFDQ